MKRTADLSPTQKGTRTVARGYTRTVTRHNTHGHARTCSFIHIPPWLVSQGGFVCGCAVHVCYACACAGFSALWCGPFCARGDDARLNPSAEDGRCRTPLLCALPVQRDSVQNPQRMEGGGERKRARLCTTLSASACTVVSVVHVSRAPAVLRCVLRRCALHMPPWFVSQGGWVCGCAVRVCCARACVALHRVVTHSLFARGDIARLNPSAEDGHCRTPTLRVDTLPTAGR